jgi:hypothetical protein
MKCEDGYELSKYSLPGVKIIMGPYECRIEKVNSIDTHNLPGEASFFEYDLKKRLGYIPSFWVQSFIKTVETKGYKISDKEINWLKTASLKEALKWLNDIL